MQKRKKQKQKTFCSDDQKVKKKKKKAWKQSWNCFPVVAIDISHLRGSQQK